MNEFVRYVNGYEDTNHYLNGIQVSNQVANSGIPNVQTNV